MALTGLQIYKLLPQTNCKDCGYPTCLAFAMKLAAKQAELSACPHVSEEAKAQLEAAAMPPIRLITLSADGTRIEAGNETVLFRHEKTFYHKPGLFIRLRDTQSLDVLKQQAAEIAAYSVNYVGLDLRIDGIAVEATSANPATFGEAVTAVTSTCKKPLILITSDPAVMQAGLSAASGVPLLYAANATNWQAMAELAKARKAPLAVVGDGLDTLASLVEQVKAAGVEDIVLDPKARRLGDWLNATTQIRRLALKNVRALGYPVIAFAGEDGNDELIAAAQAIAKYAGFVVLDHFTPASIYPLLVLRQNIYTDPQKPIQVQPGLYEINSPKPDSPVMVTTNFSITYFSVANEVENNGIPAWLLIADAEGMSVLTAWAAGKFDAEKIAKTVKATNVEAKVNHHRIIIPGQVAVLSGELEEELPGWEVLVGPREAVGIPAFVKAVWQK